MAVNFFAGILSAIALLVILPAVIGQDTNATAIATFYEEDGDEIDLTGDPAFRNQDPQTLLLAYLRQNLTQVSPQCYPNLMEGKDPMDVEFTVSLLQVMDINEAAQTLTVSLRFLVKWADCRLTWNTEEYMTEDLEIAPDFPLWYPELALLQRVNTQRINWRNDSTIWVQSTGLVNLIHYDILKAGCNIDVLWYPFDTQKCVLTFTNPIYSVEEMDIHCPNITEAVTEDSDDEDEAPDAQGVADNIENDNWNIKSVTRDCVSVNVSGKMVPAMNLHITMSRRPWYHLFNLLFPCYLLTLLCSLVFIIPPEGGKISMSLTILLAIVVFMNMLYGKMPVSAESVPLLSQYFAFCMIFVGFSCAMAVFVARIGSFRDAALVPTFPRSVEKFFCVTLGSFLLPGIAAVYKKKCNVLPPTTAGNAAATASLSTANQVAQDEEAILQRLQLGWYLLGLVIDRCFFVIYFLLNTIIFVVFLSTGFSRLK